MAYDSKPGWSGVFVGPTSDRETRAAGVTVNDLIEEFLEAVDEGFARDRYGRPFSPEAARELHWSLDGYISEALGAVALNDVGRQDVADFIFALGETGLPKGRLRALANAIRALYDYAAERDLVRHNPAVGVAIPDEDEAKPLVRPRRLDRAISVTLRLATLAFLLAALVLLAESL
jgi:site-specific recombinase XerC